MPGGGGFLFDALFGIVIEILFATAQAAFFVNGGVIAGTENVHPQASGGSERVTAAALVERIKLTTHTAFQFK